MKKKYILIITTIVLFIIVDQSIKIFMINKNISIIPSILSFNYIKNFGIAFGIEHQMNLILLVNLILIITLIYILIKNFEKNEITVPLVILISGGISNFVDRIIYGYVIDYINIVFINFPKFNLADIAIVLGVLLVIVQIFKMIFYNKNEFDKKSN